MKTEAIKDLFTGKSFPCEAITPEDKEYWDLLKESHQQMEQFMRRLSAEDREELERIQNKRQEAMHYETAEAFAQGYSLGVRLTAEAFLVRQHHQP